MTSDIWFACCTSNYFEFFISVSVWVSDRSFARPLPSPLSAPPSRSTRASTVKLAPCWNPRRILTYLKVYLIVVCGFCQKKIYSWCLTSIVPITKTSKKTTIFLTISKTSIFFEKLGGSFRVFVLSMPSTRPPDLPEIHKSRKHTYTSVNRDAFFTRQEDHGKCFES